MNRFRVGDVCEMHSLEDWRAAPVDRQAEA